MLPIETHRDAIIDTLARAGRLVLEAPPGSGKSTVVPQLLWPDTGQVVVLQPRRIAARQLAQWVSTAVGPARARQVGYHVRFEKRAAADTKVLFATYGVFWQRLLQDPELRDVSVVILDEFHERSLAADACLAFLRQLQAMIRPDLKLVVMSATLQGPELSAYLDDAPVVQVTHHTHPVAIEYVPPNGQERLADHVARAFRQALTQPLRGSWLVFVAGVSEIRQVAAALAPIAETHGYQVHELHATQDVDEQQRVLRATGVSPCVVVSTNVAETSLTLDGVVGVIDSGKMRLAAYDAERDHDTLALAHVAHANATQRAGRAGRQGPGYCLRLWSKTLETGWPEAHPPEIERVDAERLALECATLGQTWEWLTPPPPERWERAIARLQALGALNMSRQPTPLGHRLLRLPLPPRLARLVWLGLDAGYGTLCAAMVAILEAGISNFGDDEGDLLTLGLDLAGHPRASRWPFEVRASYQQLLATLRPDQADEARSLRSENEDGGERRQILTQLFLTVFGDRLAERAERAYRLADGRRGLLVRPDATMPLIVALALHERRGGPSGRQLSIPVYLPCDPAWLAAPDESVMVCLWDPVRERVTQERHHLRAGVVVRKEQLTPQEWDRNLAEAELAAQLQRQLPRRLADDDELAAWVQRLRLARTAWPEADVPEMNDDDWELLCHTVVCGMTRLDEVTTEAWLAVIREYVGELLMGRIERSAPKVWRLPSGRTARITYPAEGPPELSARLGDLIGMRGTLALFEGRVPVLFDILAPNFRTVQKTWDLDGFWSQTYPEVKKELKRRYPRHPWP